MTIGWDDEAGVEIVISVSLTQRAAGDEELARIRLRARTLDRIRAHQAVKAAGEALSRAHAELCQANYEESLAQAHLCRAVVGDLLVIEGVSG